MLAESLDVFIVVKLAFGQVLIAVGDKLMDGWLRMLWLTNELLVMSTGVVVRGRHVFGIALDAHSHSSGHPATSEADRRLASSASHATKA